VREGISLGQLREIAEHEKEELKEAAEHVGAKSSGKGE
jgi:hypothetical protein